MDVRAKISVWPTGPVLRTFLQYYLITFCSRPAAAGEVLSSRFVGLIVPDKCVKFRDPHFNRSREIPPEAVIFATTLHWKLVLTSCG